MQPCLTERLRGNYLKARAILTIIALIAVVGLLVTLALNSGIILPSARVTTPKTAPLSNSTATVTTPSTSAAPLVGTIVLAPASQTVSMYDDQYQTNFNITISPNQNSIQFPCYIGIISSQPPNGKGTSLNFEPESYGTYNFSLSSNASLKGKTIAYYALVKGSNGALIFSNTVTVEYI